MALSTCALRHVVGHSIVEIMPVIVFVMDPPLALDAQLFFVMV